MSPHRFDSGYGEAFVLIVSAGSNILGYLSKNSVSISSTVVRPVISLKSNTLVSGTGTASDPYVVEGI